MGIGALENSSVFWFFLDTIELADAEGVEDAKRITFTRLKAVKESVEQISTPATVASVEKTSGENVFRQALREFIPDMENNAAEIETVIVRLGNSRGGKGGGWSGGWNPAPVGDVSYRMPVEDASKDGLQKRVPVDKQICFDVEHKD